MIACLIGYRKSGPHQMAGQESLTRDEIIIKDAINSKQADKFKEEVELENLEIEYQITYNKGDIFEPIWNVRAPSDGVSSEVPTERMGIIENDAGSKIKYYYDQCLIYYRQPRISTNRKTFWI